MSLCAETRRVLLTVCISSHERRGERERKRSGPKPILERGSATRIQRPLTCILYMILSASYETANIDIRPIHFHARTHCCQVSGSIVCTLFVGGSSIQISCTTCALSYLHNVHPLPYGKLGFDFDSGCGDRRQERRQHVHIAAVIDVHSPDELSDKLFGGGRRGAQRGNDQRKGFRDVREVFSRRHRCRCRFGGWSME